MLEQALGELDRRPTERPLERAWLRFHAADARRILRDFETALADIDRAEKLLGDDRSAWADGLRCSLVGLRGWIQQNWGAIDAAARSFQRERELVQALVARNAGGETASVEGLLIDADMHQANLAALLGEPTRIERLLADGASFYEVRRRQRSLLELRLAYAWIELAEREDRADAAERARSVLDSALAELETADIERIRGELRLAALELARRRPDAARGLWQRAGRALETLGGSAVGERRIWTGIGARMAVEAGAETSELARWRDAVERELQGFLAEWRALTERSGGYGFMHNDHTLALFVEYGRLSLAVDGERAGARRAFELLMQAHASSSLARSLGAEAPTLQSLQSELVADEGHGLLVYLAGAAGSQVFALDRAELTLHPIADQFAVERARRRLVRELMASSGAAHGPESAAAARELSRLLLPDELRARISGWGVVATCGLDLFLGDVPFEMLELGEGRPIGTERAVYGLPSVAVGAALARTAARTRAPLAGACLLAIPTVATRVGDEYGLAELELEDEALEEMLAPYPDALRRIHVRSEARASRLAPLAEGVHVAQILAHGVRDDSRRFGTALALAPEDDRDDGLLDGAAIARLFPAGDAPGLVVATACRAGRGARRRGDAAATDLIGAFLGAGARTVLASSFDLDLEVARRVSAGFHRELWSGAPPAEALRRARAQLMSDPAFAGWVQPLLLRVVGLGNVSPFDPDATLTGELAARRADDELAVSPAAVAAIVGVMVASAAALVVQRRRR